MLRLGLVDCDTSHAVEFTRRLNRRGIGRSQQVEGAEVVVACPGTSRMAPERVPGFTAELQKLGVPLVEHPRELLGRVDAVLIESLEGGMHLPHARLFLPTGLPCFIDKPFASSLADARKLVRLAAKHEAAVFSSSSLRFAPELIAFLDALEGDRILGAVSYGPAPYFASPPGVPGNPGLFHYGIHALEVLYTLMGPGCVRVTCTHADGVDVVTGEWKDGRVGTLRGLREGKVGYGFVAFTEGGIRHVRLGTRDIYRELCKQIVAFAQTRQVPVPLETTLEMMAFLEAAGSSAGSAGAAVSVRP